jgi:hypothetical protein
MKKQEANLGQVEAHREKEKEADLAHMGEMTDRSDEPKPQ